MKKKNKFSPVKKVVKHLKEDIHESKESITEDRSLMKKLHKPKKMPRNYG